MFRRRILMCRAMAISRPSMRCWSSMRSIGNSVVISGSNPTGRQRQRRGKLEKGNRRGSQPTSGWPSREPLAYPRSRRLLRFRWRAGCPWVDSAASSARKRWKRPCNCLPPTLRRSGEQGDLRPARWCRERARSHPLAAGQFEPQIDEQGTAERPNPESFCLLVRSSDVLARASSFRSPLGCNRRMGAW